MERSELKGMLTELAEKLDGPDGPGSGAVCLWALTEIEGLERRIDPAEPGP
jgi:hypothetical protein